MGRLNPSEVLERIDSGEILVIHRGDVLKLDKWIDRHPGGDKAILHMVGRDATDEMDAYHSHETIESMKKWRIGTVELPWKNITPPIQQEEIRECSKAQGDHIDRNLEKEHDADVLRYPNVDETTQEHIRKRYWELFHELERDGSFNCDYWAYAWEAGRISSLFAISIYFFKIHQSLWQLFLSAVALGLAWHQLVFIGHDAGHLEITHNYWVDSLLGCFIGSYIGGLSLGWWKRNHNVHHLVTNDPVHDPDIQHLPFFAITSKLFGSVYSTYYEKILTFDAAARFLVPLQRYLYYPILCFGRFNLYRLSWEYVLLGLGPRKGKAVFLRWFELVGLSVFCYWYFYRVVACALKTSAERWLFLMVSNIVPMPVHVQIVLSHFAQSTSDLGPNESFPQRQVRTTMDVDCPSWIDYVHGGLQFQTIHHLFPRLPRHNYRKVQPRVIKFCEELGLHYTIYGFARCNGKVLGRLGEIANQARVFSECNEFCRQELVGGDAPRVEKARAKVNSEKDMENKENMPKSF